MLDVGQSKIKVLADSWMGRACALLHWWPWVLTWWKRRGRAGESNLLLPASLVRSLVPSVTDPPLNGSTSWYCYSVLNSNMWILERQTHSNHGRGERIKKDHAKKISQDESKVGRLFKKETTMGHQNPGGQNKKSLAGNKKRIGISEKLTSHLREEWSIFLECQGNKEWLEKGGKPQRGYLTRWCWDACLVPDHQCAQESQLKV